MGCEIECKTLNYKKIGSRLEMTNENVRFFSSFFERVQKVRA